MAIVSGFGQYIKQRFQDEGRASALSPERLAIISKLAQQPNTIVYVLSGIQVKAMSMTDVGTLPDVGLSADNGVALSWSKHHTVSRVSDLTHFGPSFVTATPGVDSAGSALKREWYYTSPECLDEVVAVASCVPCALSG